MDFKQWLYKFTRKIKLNWNDGKVQRTTRITYDVFWNIILFFLIIGFISMFFAAGIGAGYFASLVKDEEIRSYESMEKDIYNYEETTKLYFAGNTYAGDIRSDLHREETSLDKISINIINAVIATEDESFNEHKGVVPKAIIRAVLQEALNSDVKTGGSTLTQQLIKNQVLTNEVSFDRKAKEILLALRLEQFFGKDQILEAYMNIIPYGREASGRNIAGVQTAAKGIFGINADEVNIAQAAYLAGLPQSPSAYTPFVNKGGLKDEEGLQLGINRMKTVLKRMYESEYINKKQYDEALNYDIVADFIEKSSSPIEKYAYFMYEVEKQAKDILTIKLAEDDGYTKEDLAKDAELNKEYNILAERDLQTGGYNIHSTIDKKIYDSMQKVAKEYDYYGPNQTILNTETGEKIIDKDTGEPKIESVQTGAFLRENSTGKIISFVGGRGYDAGSEINHATNSYRPVGSTIKAMFVYPAAMEKGAVQPGSAIADIPATYSNGKPITNYGGGYYGMVSARQALASSYNIPAVKTYMKIIHDNPVKEYLEKMNFTILAKDPDLYVNESVALGSFDASMEENVGGFSTLGNNGQFVEGYMIEKITTNDGEVIYEHETKPVEIFSPQTTYLTIDMMRDVIRSGTAGYLNSQLKHGGVDWAGKTGTSDDYKDAWFVATNPNVTFGTWIGYDTPANIKDSCVGCSLSYSQRNLKLWGELINAAADVNPELVAPQERFKRPDGIVERSYCAISGMLPSDLCSKAGLVRSDIFNAKFVPTKVDDSLISGSYVTVNGKSVVAGPNTPKEFVKGDGLAFNPEFLKRNGYDQLADITQLYPRAGRGRELWEKIGAPGGKVGDTIVDDGKSPSAPTSVTVSNNQVSWGKSGSQDVVGYRIYYASKPGGDFKKIGDTTSTSVSLSNDTGVFYVKAVDYFGLESNSSEQVVNGDFPDPEEEKEKLEKEKQEKEEEKQEKEKEKEKQEQEKEKQEKEKQEKEEKEDDE